MKDFDFKAFENNGFIPIEDSGKQIKVIYNGEEFKVDFMTNIVHKITDDLIIAIGKKSIDSECELFINRDFNPLCGEEYTSPFRTFYPGLMKEPFSLVYPLKEGVETKIITDKNERITVSII